jgi:hypothetical protein
MADHPSTVAPSLSRLAIDRSAVAPRRRRPLWKRWWVWTLALIVLAAVAFTLTPSIVVSALVFSVVMGFVGGFLPAIKASRMKIVDALRAD